MSLDVNQKSAPESEKHQVFDFDEYLLPAEEAHSARPNRLFDFVHAWVMTAAVFAPSVDLASVERANSPGVFSSVSMPPDARKAYTHTVLPPGGES